MVRRIVPILFGLLIALVLAVWLGIPSLRGPWLGAPDAEPPEVQHYVPIDLDPAVRARLLVWDYPWPHADPMADPQRFQGEQPRLWRQRLEAAVEAFRRRYPNVEVVIEQRSFAETQGLLGSEGAAGTAPDLQAVWWNGPMPLAQRLVPVDPYLDDETRAEYHPLAWRLLEDGDVHIGWPRWIAVHYWLAPAAPAAGWSAVLERGWTVHELRERLGSEAMLLVPPAAPDLLLELLATVRPPAGEDGSSEARADLPADPVAELARVLEALRAWIPEEEVLRESLAQRFLARQFDLAAGFGPALGAWAVSPPWSGRTDVDPQGVVLLPPPTAWEPATRVPVFSAGAYVVLRRDGDGERVRAQLAMELARHLTRWEPEAAVARLLAFPAYRAAIQRWQGATSLPPTIRQRLLTDAAYAGSLGERRYGQLPGTPAGTQGPASVEVTRVYQAWLAGDLDAGEAARQLFGENSSSE